MNIGILGAGAYGIALASVINKNHGKVQVWTPIKEEYETLQQTRVVSKLNNYVLPETITITNDIKEVCADKDLIVIAIPTQFLNDVILQMKPYITTQHLCIATKGMENNTCRFCHDMITSQINTTRIAAISGPTFAIDMINEVTVGLALGTKNEETENIVKKAFCNNFLKLRVTKDITGVEFCGAIKNVIAIAVGMIDGMNLPESTKAMFITESLHDVSELLEIFDGNKKTILSFAGFGDLLLTCTSPKSRNFSFGKLIGSDADAETIEAYRKNTTIEGLYTLDSIHQFGQDKHINMPIIELIYDIIYNNHKPQELLSFLINKS